ncbi:hypothetical protein MLD38_040269 [Melastoma candidum]|uniref:Uncharacterized protein n=1 Tax=Melastoma candidum TaxID=119954 RepID=A0ACB9L576_9MYRT|nr:hypothetical protein MLD38_040269 [Melastoma candidum]
MAACFQQGAMDEDSTVLFSTSDSPAVSASPSSSSHHSPPGSLRQGYKLTVKNLSYSVRPQRGNSLSSCLGSRQEPVEILKSVSFSARSSEITAIVGPSGTGKSTLIRVIAGRVEGRRFDPNCISINSDRIETPVRLRKMCGFVEQEDSLLPLLTVKETLTYAADFRLRRMNRKEKDNRVECLMGELGLVHVANTYVGDEENRGISGGERRRVSIGVDVINDPPILLLDEPTSGLDSKSALQVIKLLASMAKAKRRTIIVSIHQPSYRILEYIPTILILYHGSVVHNGSIEALEETINSLGFRIPTQLNPLEFAMEILKELQIAYKKDQDEDRQNLPYSSYVSWPEVEATEQTKKPFTMILDLVEIRYLCSRFASIIYRTKQLLLARTMQAIVGGFGLGSVYIKVGRDETGVAERLGLFGFSLSFLLSTTVEALPIFLQERRVIMKESSRGAYKISSYMIANTIVFLPFLLAVSILFAVPVYWTVGLNPSATAFAFFSFVVWSIVLMASSLVLFLSSISPDFVSGNSLICTVLGAFFLFSGYFIPKQSIPKYWLFMYYVSLYRYPLDTLITNEYWGLRTECFSQKGNECVLTGEDVLRSRGLERDTRWINVGIMFGFFLLYRVLCWAVLVRRASRTTT